MRFEAAALALVLWIAGCAHRTFLSAEYLQKLQREL